MEKIAIVFCLHGNEKYGAEVVAKLPASYSRFLANKEALKENVRFIDDDMNRVFPGKIDGNHEERLAFDLKNRLRNFDCVLDLHSSSNDCPLFGIVTNPTIEHIRFAKRLGLKKLVVFYRDSSKSSALIDHVKCGISLEVGSHGRKENAEEVLELIGNLDGKVDVPMEIFEFKKNISKESDEVLLKNFCDVKNGDLIEKGRFADEDFTPVLVNEEAYGGILCMACRKVGEI